MQIRSWHGSVAEFAHKAMLQKQKFTPRKQEQE